MKGKLNMANTKLTEQKIKMWEEKLAKLEKEYADIMVVRGEAMLMGDLRENAAFQMADEDAGTYNVRMDEVKGIIAKLQVELEKGGSASAKKAS